MKINKLDELLNLKHEKPMKLVVVACHDEEVLAAVLEGKRLGIAEPILIGDKEKTIEIAKEKGLDISSYTIIDEKDLNMAAEIGVKMVSSGKANFIMKGLVDTSILLKAVLNKEWGLRTDSLLSHVMLYDIPNYSKLIYLTDGGMNLQPTLEDKVKIIENAVTVAKALGKEEVKVACLAAKEKLDPKMVATVDASELKYRYEEGKFSKGTIVDGPMALDLAVSSSSAEIKGYKSKVSGDADVLLVPNIEMGNGIGKSITYFAGGKSAGVVMGAKAPIVLVSRADDHEAKLYSIALGSLVAAYKG
ncbi:bifunctional enoyl-CoA hydratase/phosphate acetyltransferase [Tissierella carlieri]|uniref:bifunctional enoyl-CoA hydratase/phosphate acetyltransferase n=1 Tax=Tissierella TaxID=41273 RepID=UPI000BA0D191|nr:MULTISPECIES: bifunctional enoyl-CoA hydratase/phosphate acetyltransferase [Tissierella]MBU5313388.1 bifunctional enoyl-CoA hydratase/phosphate acetyltransferase [Tissierella carlieri]OZV10512.1 phosphate butyryltransferase [Tissierella sp. P1]